MAKHNSAPNDPILAELISIKRLLAFSLLRSGANQTDLARALGLDQSQVSRMFPNPIGKATNRSTRRK